MEASQYGDFIDRVKSPVNFSQIAAAFHGFQHSDFVGVFEIGADGDAYAGAGNANAKGLQQFRKIHGGGFAFGSGIGGDDDLFNCAALQSFDQGLDVELIGAASLEGGKQTTHDATH